MYVIGAVYKFSYTHLFVRHYYSLSQLSSSMTPSLFHSKLKCICSDCA